jgi:LuxR family transcriptional regulator, maltose regulon positive regulatory protein
VAEQTVAEQSAAEQSVAEQSATALRSRTSRSDLPPGYLERPRLNSLLDVGAHKPVTVVSAGPGYGKTLAVSAWIGQPRFPWPVAWLTADNSHDTQSLWTDVLETLRISGALPLGGPLREISPGPSFGTTDIDRIVEAFSALPTPVVVIIDDFHHIDDTAVLDTLGKVLEQRIPQLRLVIVSRSDPGLRLSRLRLSGDVTEVGAAELAFTMAECRSACAIAGFDLRDADLALLQDRTQGWPAGVRLALLSAAESTGVVAALEHFGGDNRRVAAYLLEEILEQLSSDDRQFLLKTSVVEQLTPGLARALSGRADSLQVLEALVSRNALTVRLTDRPNWFRYHPLLRELLRNRLVAEYPDGLAEVHRSAAEWFAEMNQPIPAVGHYVVAHEWHSATTLLGRVALPLMVTSQAPALAAALAPAYDELLLRRAPEPLLAAVLCDHHRRDYRSMVHKADQAERLIESSADPAPPVHHAIIGMARIVYARSNVPGTLVAEADRMLDLVHQLDAQNVPAAAAYDLLASNNRACGLVFEGRIDEAQPVLTTIQTRGSHAGMSLTELSASSYLALIEFLHGNLTRARTTSAHILDTATTKGWSREVQLLASYATAALVHLEIGEPIESQRHIDAGLAMSRRGSDLGCRVLLYLAAIGVANAGDDLFEARAQLENLAATIADAGELPLLLRTWVEVARADVLTLAGEPGTALAVLTDCGDRSDYAAGLSRIARARAQLALAAPAAALQTLDVARRHAPCRTLAAECAVLETVAYGRLRRDSTATERFARAIALAEPAGLVRPFLLRDHQIRTHLIRYRQLSGDKTAFVAGLAAATGTTDDQQVRVPVPMSQPLTERERAVLNYLPTLFTAAEIADLLFVSVNTVKTHQRLIYRKLSVTNRRDAVECARYWNLL